MGKKATILAVVIGFALASVMAMAAAKAPDSVDLKKYVDKRPLAKFDHKKHVEVHKAECKACHHEMKKEDDKVQSCGTQGCHVAQTEGKKLGLTGVKNAFHDGCWPCHKKENAAGKKAPVKCDDCHVKA